VWNKCDSDSDSDLSRDEQIEFSRLSRNICLTFLRILRKLSLRCWLGEQDLFILIQLLFLMLLRISLFIHGRWFRAWSSFACEQNSIPWQETHFSSRANLGWYHRLLILAPWDSGNEDMTDDHQLQSQLDGSQIQFSLSWNGVVRQRKIENNFCMWWL
jgi:hypothetical protein